MRVTTERVKRLSEEEVQRARQLYRAGFSLEKIAKALGVSKVAIFNHVKDDTKGDLADFVKALLPHLPHHGPPLPRGYSLRWIEMKRLADQHKPREKTEGK